MSSIEDSLLLPLSLRLAKRLLDLARVYGEQTSEGVLIRLQLPQEDLGRMLGATRQSINKALRQFENQRLIKQHNGRILICEISAFKALIDATA